MTIRDWLIVAVIASTGVFQGAVFNTVVPSLPLIIQHYGGGQHGTFVAESLLTMPSIGIVVGGPITGWFVERSGSRAVLLTCLVVFGLVGLSGLVVEDSTLLLASRFIVGVAAVGQSTAATAMVGEVFTSERRGAMLGLLVALATLTGVALTLAAGQLAEHAGWHAPFSLYGLAFLVAVVSAIVVAAPAARARRVGKAEGSLLPLLPIFFMAAVALMAAFIASNQVPLILVQLGSPDPSLISMVSGATTLTTTAGALLYSRIFAILGGTRTTALGGALQGAGILCLAVAPSVPVAILGSIILGFGSGTLLPAFSHRILDRAPESLRGRAVGLLFSTKFAGSFLSTALVVPAVIRFGRHDSLLLGAAALLIGWIVPALRRSAGHQAPVVAPAAAKIE